jgi:hypothetical protein
LAEIPSIKIFYSQIPYSNIVKGSKDCCPSPRVNLNTTQKKGGLLKNYIRFIPESPKMNKPLSMLIN